MSEPDTIGDSTMPTNQGNSEKQPQTRTSRSTASHLSREDLRGIGKSLRKKCPRSDHSAWEPAAHRPDPVSLIEESNQGRMPQLVPIRHGRMLQSPFAFYRGAALNMAADLAGTPASGI